MSYREHTTIITIWWDCYLLLRPQGGDLLLVERLIFPVGCQSFVDVTHGVGADCCCMVMSLGHWE